MCLAGNDAPAAPAPLPAQAPPQVVKLEAAEGSSSPTTSAIAANRGRSSLRIDKTQNAPGSAGSGLVIPT